MADKINQLAMSSMKELQDMLRWWRGINRAILGDVLPGRYPDEPMTARLFRTQGPLGTEDEAEYPTQVDGDGARLTGRLLEITRDDSASDPITVAVYEELEHVHSPWGWIPRLVDIEVVMISGLLSVNYVPIIPVTFSGVGVTAPDTVIVTVADYGIADGQEFTAHVVTQQGAT